MEECDDDIHTAVGTGSFHAHLECRDVIGLAGCVVL